MESLWPCTEDLFLSLFLSLLANRRNLSSPFSECPAVGTAVFPSGIITGSGSVQGEHPSPGCCAASNTLWSRCTSALPPGPFSLPGPSHCTSEQHGSDRGHHSSSLAHPGVNVTSLPFHFVSQIFPESVFPFNSRFLPPLIRSIPGAPNLLLCPLLTHPSCSCQNDIHETQT